VDPVRAGGALGASVGRGRADADEPSPGNAFYYLMRVNGPAGVGTYGGGTAARDNVRDPLDEALPGCPRWPPAGSAVDSGAPGWVTIPYTGAGFRDAFRPGQPGEGDT
jgi:hypothetical protein